MLVDSFWNVLSSQPTMWSQGLYDLLHPVFTVYIPVLCDHITLNGKKNIKLEPLYTYEFSSWSVGVSQVMKKSHV